MNHVDLWVDVQRLRLVSSSGVFVSEPPAFVRGDDLMLRIRFVDVDRTASPFVVTARQFPGGTHFFFAGKSSFSGGLLVFADEDKWNDDADWTGDGGLDPLQGRCSCRVTFGSSELLSAMSDSTFNVWFDISAALPDGTVSTLWRLELPVLNDIYRGNEGSPEPAAPTYPTSAQLDARIPPGVELRAVGDEIHFYLNEVYRGKL